ncbi:MAG: hypothetical protein NC928_04430 [Candidatus Omnitrophica bacterium]|nr:hypothetical protein [Candidatus Omnitrophota bacterium]
MAQTRPLSPEKQLLKLIEDSNSKTSAVSVEAIKHQSLSLFSFGAWLGRISFFKEGFKKWFQGVRPHQLDIKLINKLLGCLIFVLGVYFISTFFGSLVSLKKMPSYLEIKPQEGMTVTRAEETSFLKKASSYYLEKARARDIFKMGGEKTTTTSEAASPKGFSSKIIEATQHLKLVGISWSNDPDAMIEDTRALRTFFVKKGQMIGEVRVEAIFKDKVVLRYAGEEIELR